MPDQQERYKKALKTLAKMGGAQHAKKFDANNQKTWLTPTMRDFTEIVSGYTLGEVWSRPGLDMRSRSVATISTLAALRQWDQLRSHVKMGLNIGLTPDEIVEIVLHLSVYAGVPAAASAYAVVQDVLKEHKP